MMDQYGILKTHETIVSEIFHTGDVGQLITGINNV